MNSPDIQYCCLKCHKNIHIFNHDIVYCIDCGNTDINTVCQLKCMACLATYTIIEKVNRNLDQKSEYICPSCTYIIKNMHSNKQPQSVSAARGPIVSAARGPISLKNLA